MTPAVEAFARQYLNQKIDTSDPEVSGYTGVIVGYCSCGCESLVVELDEMDRQQRRRSGRLPVICADKTAVILRDSADPDRLAYVAMTDIKVIFSPPNDFIEYTKRLDFIINSLFFMKKKKEITKALIQYDLLFSKVEQFLTRTQIKDYMLRVRSSINLRV